MHQPKLTELAAADPTLAALIEGEVQRQHDKLRMIASENYVSSAVLDRFAPRWLSTHAPVAVTGDVTRAR